MRVDTAAAAPTDPKPQGVDPAALAVEKFRGSGRWLWRRRSQAELNAVLLALRQARPSGRRPDRRRERSGDYRSRFMRLTARIALTATVLAFAHSASAQDFPNIGGQYYDFGASMMAVGQMNNVLDSTDRSGGSGVRAGAGLSASRQAVSVDTRYRASPAVTSRVKGQFADFVAKTDPANGPRLRQVVQQQDLLGAWERHVSVDGLRRGDVADAMAAYWVQNWQIANNVPFTDRAQVQAVRAQVHRALGSNPRFARLDDAGKQEMAEVFMLNQVAQASAFTDATAKGDKGLRSRLSNAAVARFRKEMNVDLRQLNLTPTGFVPQ